jgi:hypothetical protein
VDKRAIEQDGLFGLLMSFSRISPAPTPGRIIKMQLIVLLIRDPKNTMPVPTELRESQFQKVHRFADMFPISIA